MTMRRLTGLRVTMLALALALTACAAPPPKPVLLDAQMDAKVDALMTGAQVPGLAVALIRDGRPVFKRAYGFADREHGELLKTDTVMAAAALTETAFAYLVLQLADEGQIDLDLPLRRQLRLPLHLYADYGDLTDELRWLDITPRMLLSHTSGLSHWRAMNPAGKLRLDGRPGQRYVLSGEGIQLLQLIVEERTREPLAGLMQKRVFDRFGMVNTSMTWRADFATHAAKAYGVDGIARSHVQHSQAQAALSMDTTLDDYAAFFAGVLRGEGLSAKAQQQMLSAPIAITSPQQMSSHGAADTAVNKGIALAAGLGWVVYHSPRGVTFFAQGKAQGTSNLALGFADSRDGLLLLSNSRKADALMFEATELLLGAPTICLPWFWMGDLPFDRPEMRKTGARDKALGPGCDFADQLAEGSRK